MELDHSQIPDRIANIFNGRTILITGGTGFIGKALIEKLLRGTTVKKIYILIREKKGRTPNERLQDLFKNVVFKSLLETRPDAITKCFCVVGDVALVDLGITKEDREMLQKEVDFIFHSAATTRFDETLKYAVTMNTRGTKYVLDLAEQCKQLKLLIHVSTAYAFPLEKTLYEKEYDPPVNPHEVLNKVNWIDEGSIINLTEELRGGIPNSYTFSKSLAEALVYEKVGKIPVIICRLAVVVPSYKEPFPGWFNNLQGPVGLFVAAGKGVLRSMHMDGKSYANLIPVDSAVHLLMAASWQYETDPKSNYIYNVCVPQCDVKFSWESLIKAGLNVINEKVPFNGILWYPGGGMTRSRTYHRINVVLFQIIPAILIDFLLMMLGYKPILYNIQMRILKGGDMFEFYTNRSWNFDTKQLEQLRKKFNEREKQTYALHADEYNLEEHMEDCILSCRRHVLKETDDMLPSAKRVMKIMYAIDQLTKAVIVFVAGYYIYKWMIMFML